MGIEEGGLAYEVSEADLYGIEEALHQRSLHQGSVTAITLGPGRAKEALHVAYAKGVDLAIHVVDEASRGLDPAFNVLAAAEIVKKLDFDMVFAGIQAEDDLQGQFGIGLAEVLGIPVITAVTEIRADPGAKVATVIRELGGGFKEELEIDLPCLLTIQFGIRPLRYTPVMAIVKARSRRIESVPADTLAVAPRKPAGGGRLHVLKLSYPEDSGRCELIDGSPEEAARKLVKRLAEEGVVCYD
ncbi:MAG: hypothetical protein A3H35_20720 [Betaproteobacteria bacterium RIFCSPLOWO2_02_FULL_62_17]|nr:MAG: hypothetical protein A3H35_20720 [Betaproteobacteria bacterium RIFCSPLOWO2_02_FULL_62_17]